MVPEAKRPADAIARAVMIGKIASGENEKGRAWFSHQLTTHSGHYSGSVSAAQLHKDQPADDPQRGVIRVGNYLAIVTLAAIVLWLRYVSTA